MALSSAIAWDVRTAGSDNSGGGFKVGASGTDRSQQNAAFASGTNLTVDPVTNTKVTPDGYTVVSADVGNVIQITAGVGFTTGFYEITAAAGGEWTLDRSPGAVGVTGGTWAMGGALASPGKAAGAKVAGNTVYVKSGTYTCSATSNVAAGRVSDTATGTATAPNVWEGYGSTHGDMGTKPVLNASAASMTVFTASGSHTQIRNIEVGGNGNATVTGFSFSADSLQGYKLKATSTTTAGFNTSGNQVKLILCEEASGTGTTGFTCTGAQTTYLGCVSHDGTHSSGAFNMNAVSGCVLWRCVADTTAGPGFLGATGGARYVCIECTSYGATGGSGYGYQDTGSSGSHYFNCIAYGNSTGSFFGDASGTLGVWMFNCAFDTAPSQVASSNQISCVTLSADPFANAAGNDFSLNNTAGGGAALRTTGFPSSFPSLSGTSYQDIGAYQTQTSNTAAGTAIFLTGRRG